MSIVPSHQQVVGTTGRGKTTTMNLFTGNKVSCLEKKREHHQNQI